MKSDLNSRPSAKLSVKFLATLASIVVFSIIGLISYLFGVGSRETWRISIEDDTIVTTIIVLVVTGIAVLSVNAIITKLISKFAIETEPDCEHSKRNKISIGLLLVFPIIAFTFGIFRIDLAPIWSIESRAAAYYRANAIAGDAEAQSKLGWFYSKGYGLHRSRDSAVYWWRKAALQGHPKAQSNMGYAYAKGVGIKQNYREAAYWYSLSAAQGSAASQNILGGMYKDGKGVKKSYCQSSETILPRRISR